MLLLQPLFLFTLQIVLIDSASLPHQNQHEQHQQQGGEVAPSSSSSCSNCSPSNGYFDLAKKCGKWAIKTALPTVLPWAVDAAVCSYWLSDHRVSIYLTFETIRLVGLEKQIDTLLEKVNQSPKCEGHIFKRNLAGILLGKNGIIQLTLKNAGVMTAPSSSVVIQQVCDYLEEPEEYMQSLREKYDGLVKMVKETVPFICKPK